MIQRYKDVSIIYGGSGRAYAEALNERLVRIAAEERYPIQATIINERILTRELLADVIRLFKESEFCVAFLTQDDSCRVGENGKKRLRQNVVFELGMALIELGRERCILLSDFDTKGADFDLPSDMNSLEILKFDGGHPEDVLDAVVEKLLAFSRNSVVTGVETDTIPQYDHLLTRGEYLIDYENIFVERPLTLAFEGKDFFNDTLSYWVSECSSLPNFDERCIYLLERVGFLPIFGRIPAAISFMEQAQVLIERYRKSDIRYYGGSELLDFTKDLVQSIIDYTVLKTRETEPSERLRKYRNLLQNMLSERVPEPGTVNPLILVTYYDYLGLTYFRLCDCGQDKHMLEKAEEAFRTAMRFVSSVDMSQHIWAGFINYNLARVYTAGGDVKQAVEYFRKAVRIRSEWLKCSAYNITVRTAMSFEYFIAKIDEIDMRKQFGLMTPEEAHTEYTYVDRELEVFSDIDDKLDRLLYVRKILQDRLNSDAE